MKIKPLLSFFLIGVLFLISGCTHDHEKMLYDQKPAFYSYILGDVQGNHISAEHQADAYVIPASCQKTITALLAYKIFGPDYHYETSLYITKEDYKIHDVIISFAGDPTLKSEDLIQLLKPLRGATVAGKILLDVSLFKTPPCSANLMLSDIGTEYAQPVSSANIDRNLVTVRVRPSKKIGRRAIVTNDSGYPIDSSVTTKFGPSSVALSIINNRIKANGNISPRHRSLELKISPLDFDGYLLHKVKNLIKRARMKGRVVIVREKSELPTKLILWNTSESESLGDIIPSAIKKSDNLIFDSLYLKIIHLQDTGVIKDWDDGSGVIKGLIYKYFGIDTASSMFVDGSGLSRRNVIQPRKLFEILKKGYYVEEFTDALASPGESKSTLAGRAGLLKNIKAKTGNMSGISCLCGYGISEHPRVFVIIANNFAPPNRSIFPVLDNFINNYLEK